MVCHYWNKEDVKQNNSKNGFLIHCQLHWILWVSKKISHLPLEKTSSSSSLITSKGKFWVQRAFRLLRVDKNFSSSCLFIDILLFYYSILFWILFFTYQLVVECSVKICTHYFSASPRAEKSRLLFQQASLGTQLKPVFQRYLGIAPVSVAMVL